MKGAVVLLSGGIDSMVAAHRAQMEYKNVRALSFCYMQSNRNELLAAERIADKMGLQWDLENIPDLVRLAGPAHVIPGRNLIFLALAAHYAHFYSLERIFIGSNKDDYTDYADCRLPFFVDAQRAINTGKAPSERHIMVCAPLVDMTKAEVVREAVVKCLPVVRTVSCYDHGYPITAACGQCNACKLRLAAFKENGLVDPVEYVTTR